MAIAMSTVANVPSLHDQSSIERLRYVFKHSMITFSASEESRTELIARPRKRVLFQTFLGRPLVGMLSTHGLKPSGLPTSGTT